MRSALVVIQLNFGIETTEDEVRNVVQECMETPMNIRSIGTDVACEVVKIEDADPVTIALPEVRNVVLENYSTEELTTMRRFYEKGPLQNREAQRLCDAIARELAKRADKGQYAKGTSQS